MSSINLAVIHPDQYSEITIEISPDTGCQIPIDARLFLDVILSDSDDESTMQTLGPFARGSEWAWTVTGSLEM